MGVPRYLMSEGRTFAFHCISNATFALALEPFCSYFYFCICLYYYLNICLLPLCPFARSAKARAHRPRSLVLLLAYATQRQKGSLAFELAYSPKAKLATLASCPCAPCAFAYVMKWKANGTAQARVPCCPCAPCAFAYEMKWKANGTAPVASCYCWLCNAKAKGVPCFGAAGKSC